MRRPAALPPPTGPLARLGRAARRRAGFSLLELMVAVSVMAMAAAILMGTQSTSTRMVTYANKLSLVVMLTRAKMQDLEYELLLDGFTSSADGVDSRSGDFGDEGYPDVTWEAEIEGILIDDDTANQFVASIEEQLFGSEEEAGSLQGAGVSIGSALPMLITFLPNIINQIGERIRLVKLTVTWEHLGQEQSLSVSQYVVQVLPPEEAPEQSPAGAAGSDATLTPTTDPTNPTTNPSTPQR